MRGDITEYTAQEEQTEQTHPFSSATLPRAAAKCEQRKVVCFNHYLSKVAFLKRQNSQE